ncbi:MAG: class I SAM-dependent methyltransferase [Cyanobacteria bacterium J069]|nr:MAG: class I SAM-dependent methyltransferase [Cyanobacteria bacterium J069]
MSSLDQLRAQFDNAPYPRIPLERSPVADYEMQFVHSLVTPHYLRYRQVVNTVGKTILDAGCGTGFKAHLLAIANPGATIIGVDLSEESVKLARQRLEYHQIPNAEFYTLLIEDLPRLGIQFDYINCDETLYLVPDPLAALQAMASVLKPSGILRVNLHSALQRHAFYRAQELFRGIGLMNPSTSQREAVQVVINTMKALKPEVVLKQHTWKPDYEQPESDGSILANHLLVGDKGFTIPEVFELLNAAQLEFLSMVNWRHWQVPDLFQDGEDLPALWGMSLLAAAPQDHLRMYELLHPVNRLLDFWCVRVEAPPPGLSVDDWGEAEWQQARAHLHPILRAEPIREAAIASVTTSTPFELTRYIDLPAMGMVSLTALETACLLPLWDGPQPVATLAQRWQQLHPTDWVTLEPLSLADAFASVQNLLNRLDAFLYGLLECDS